ncbi:MAG: efflux RND transporter periplasmic adaptor subunit [Candidatus Methylomirabilis oxygeniifera]|uniref:Putative Macrolide-specific efflux protein macA n=1 Tax=Methylomirabilis oxygeniifera TaxID=671143 RepID=D5MEZ1_METO1|nr:MAG: efflux RND transporter periplasmic adaptor subunit [Candidatus Methylomirabilis oxyfera]CBE68320.1 putative Macrolide-specific efflux protein macA precursor [Candidatus Methylomirabilis oxyfera]
MRCRFVARSCGLLLLLLPPLLGCSREQAANGAPAVAKEQSLAITVTPVEARTVIRRVEVVGTLEADEEVMVYGQVSGSVERILVDLGDRVRAGQPLLQLDQADLQLQVGKAEAILRQTRTRLGAMNGGDMLPDDQQPVVRQAKANSDDAALWYERMRSLYKEGAVSRNDLDTALAKSQALQAALDSAMSQVRALADQLREQQAALDLARRNLQYTVIRAPIDGSIKERNVSAGQYIAGGSMQNTKLLTLVRDDPLKLKASVPERFQGQIRPGQEVKVQVEAYPGREFSGTAKRVGPAVFTDTRTFPIEARVPNREGLLKPGSFAKVRIQIRVDRAIPFVPEDAVYYFVGITKAFVVTDGVAQERQITVGERQDGLVEIVEGLQPGEQVATSRLSQLFGGATVQVMAK